LLNKDTVLQLLSQKGSAAETPRPFRAPGKRKFSLPATLLEFQPEYILGARISRTSHKVASVALAGLEAGSLAPLIGRPNLLKPEEVAAKVLAVVNVLGSDKGPFGLLLPDGVVRVSILDFEMLPAGRKEQESLIRWKMKPLLPYPLEEARLSFEVAAKEPKGVEALVMAVRKSVVAEYESALKALNGEVTLVLPSSAALLPLLDEDAAAGELLLNISPTHLTAVVAKGQQIRLWRSQAMSGKTSGEGLAAVSEEAVRTLAASHDYLDLEITRVRICARPGVPEDWVTELGRRLLREVRDLVPNPRISGIKLSDEEGQILREFGAPVCGLVANAA
jgi:hypothetical protein